jgi:hypothetical protein
MAETVGHVWSIEWSGDSTTACVQIGRSADDTEALYVYLDGTRAQRALRGSLVTALTRALLTGHKVHVVHGDTDGRIVDLTVGGQGAPAPENGGPRDGPAGADVATAQQAAARPIEQGHARWR